MIDRTPSGRFASGNAGGPGRPPAAREESYRATLHRVVTPERWERVIGRALVDAELGDAKARAFLAGYLLGPIGTIFVQQSPPQYELTHEEKAACIWEEIQKARARADTRNPSGDAPA